MHRVVVRVLVREVRDDIHDAWQLLLERALQQRDLDRPEAWYDRLTRQRREEHMHRQVPEVTNEAPHLDEDDTPVLLRHEVGINALGILVEDVQHPEDLRLRGSSEE